MPGLRLPCCASLLLGLLCIHEAFTTSLPAQVWRGLLSFDTPTNANTLLNDSSTGQLRQARDGEGPAPARNYAAGRPVRASSVMTGSKLAAAVDGQTWAVFEDAETHAATVSEPSPWVEIDLGIPTEIHAIEVWVPFRKCAHYLMKLEKDDKVLVQRQLANGHRPAHFCRGGWPSFEPTTDRPLLLELLDSTAETTIHSIRFLNRSAVYSWNGVDRQAQMLRVAVPPGEATALHIAEVKIFGASGTGWCQKNDCGEGVCGGDGLCECPSKMVGEHCEYNIMGAEHFLPHKLDHGWWKQHDAVMYQKSMASFQSRCRNRVQMRKEKILPGPGGMGAGLGSTMYFRTAVMTEAFSMKKAYLYYGRFNYALNKYCQSHSEFGTFECYFEPLIPCPKITHQLRSSEVFPSAQKKGPRGEDCLVPDSHGVTSAGCSAATRSFMTVPRAFAKRGLFWWRMMQIGMLMRPNERTADLLNLDALKEKIGYQHPIIGVHMRSGDGCRYGLRARMFDCRALKDYLPEIRALSQKYGVRRVFLSTDDKRAIHDAKTLSTEFEFVVVETDRSTLKSNVKIEHRLTGIAGPPIDSHATMISTLQDLFLLSEADYLVTHQASTMSRIALQLSTLFHRRVTPYFSMDGPWCPHWRMCCDPDHVLGTSREC